MNTKSVTTRKTEPSSMLDAIDTLNHAYRKFDAALMATAALEDDRHRRALDALLDSALTDMRAGIEAAAAGGLGRERSDAV